MAFFPTNPVDGEQASVGNILYQWSNTISAWNRVGSTVGSFLVDGTTVSITGNILCSGSGSSLFSSDLTVLGNACVGGLLFANSFSTGTLSTSNIAANSLVITGNISAGSISTPGPVTTGPISATGSINSSQQVTAGSISSSGNVTALGNIIASTNFIGSGNLSVLGQISSQTINAIGTISAGGAITTSSTISAAGNISGSNLISQGALSAQGGISAVGNISAGNIDTPGNITCGNILTDNYFFANGVPFSGGGGGGTSSPRVTVTGYTGSVSANSTASINATGYLGYVLYQVQVDTPNAWVKIYTSEAARSADSSRSIGTDPLPSAGVVAEIIAATASTYSWAPAVVGYNNENPPNTQIAMAVTNIGSSTANIGVTLTLVKLEDPA
jgi:hypothetical protein